MGSENKKYAVLSNNNSVEIEAIPVLDYEEFSNEVVRLLQKKENHCVTYFAYPEGNGLKFIAGIADDLSHLILILSHFLP
jgi:hypothetical protein